MLVFNLASSFL